MAHLDNGVEWRCRSCPESVRASAFEATHRDDLLRTVYVRELSVDEGLSGDALLLGNNKAAPGLKVK